MLKMRYITFLILILSSVTLLMSQSFTEISFYPERTDQSVIIDFDQDGDLDVFASYSNTPSFGWLPLYKNNGDGTFSRELIYEVLGTKNSGLISGNLDADTTTTELLFHSLISGTTDGNLVVSTLVDESYQSTEVELSSNFSSKAILSIGDIDGDGDNDIGLIGPFTNRVGWLENNGDLSFTEHYLDLVNDLANAILADIDSDGKDELIVTRNGISTLGLVYYNAEEENPEPIVISDTYQSSKGLVSVDFNGDNLIDLITGNDPPFSTGHVVFWTNNGELPNPTFTPDTIPCSVSAIEDIFYTDIDNDDDFDLIVSGAEDEVLVLLQNNGDTPVTYTESVISDRDDLLKISVADLDGDGDKDIVMGNTVIEFSWWSNNLIVDTVSSVFTVPTVEPLLIYPTVSNDLITVELSDESTTLGSFYEIIDEQGKPVGKGNLNNILNTISINNLAVGHYRIIVTRDRKSLSIGSFVKM